MPLLAQFLIGLLFGSGLVVSGMSNPEKVLNFLDLAAIPSGAWDPSLALVMAGGVIVTFLGYRIVLKLRRPLFDTEFHLSRFKDINAAIFVGPAIFGMGWGLVGFCPGPAFTAVGAGNTSALLFVLAMVAGMIVARMLALRQLGIASPGTAR